MAITNNKTIVLKCEHCYHNLVVDLGLSLFGVDVDSNFVTTMTKLQAIKDKSFNTIFFIRWVHDGTESEYRNYLLHDITTNHQSPITNHVSNKL